MSYRNSLFIDDSRLELHEEYKGRALEKSRRAINKGFAAREKNEIKRKWNSGQNE
jgi:hypothetical protein